VGVEAEVEKKRRRRSSQEITALIEEYRQSGQTRRIPPNPILPLPSWVRVENVGHLLDGTRLVSESIVV